MILTDKSTTEEVKVKARLVCRGFEETVKVQADSLTGSKETLHILLSMAASRNWKIKSGDVKNNTCRVRSCIGRYIWSHRRRGRSLT